MLIKESKKDPNKLQQQMSEMAGQSQSTHSILQQIIVCKKHDARPYINKISVPTLIISGLKEPVVTQEETQILAEAIKNVRRTTLLNCGHFLQCEFPKDVAKELLNFLGDCARKLNTRLYTK